VQKVLLIICIALRSQSALFAQDSIQKAPPPVKKKYNVGQFFQESFLFVKQPTQWKGRNWLTLGVVTAGTVLSMQLDKTIRNSTQGNQHFYHSAWIEGGRIYGEGYSIPIVAGAFGAYGLIAKSTKSKKIAIELVQAGLFSEFLTTILKGALGRARPYTNEGVYSYHAFHYFNSPYNSFPSGHTTAAWALSTVISSTASSDVVKFLAYVPAGFTMFSRIYQDKHWFSDSVAGAAVGYFVGSWVVNLHDEKKHQIKITSVYPLGISIGLN
jgi:membrane-associated phospholipid phosphatase